MTYIYIMNDLADEAALRRGIELDKELGAGYYKLHGLLEQLSERSERDKRDAVGHYLTD